MFVFNYEKHFNFILILKQLCRNKKMEYNKLLINITLNILVLFFTKISLYRERSRNRQKIITLFIKTFLSCKSYINDIQYIKYKKI